jgi:hypothetical protein
VRRGKQRRADYLLHYRRDFPLAMVEAKDLSLATESGVQQAREHTEMLGLKFAYATNGHRIIEIVPPRLRRLGGDAASVTSSNHRKVNESVRSEPVGESQQPAAQSGQSTSMAFSGCAGRRAESAAVARWRHLRAPAHTRGRPASVRLGSLINPDQAGHQPAYREWGLRPRVATIPLQPTLVACRSECLAAAGRGRIAVGAPMRCRGAQRPWPARAARHVD